jgi:DNA repair ATPase RecN
VENNELLQAIGTMLQPIHTRLDKIDTRLDQMDARFDKVDARLDKIEQDVTEVKQRTTKIEVTLENQTNKSIQLLAEGHANVVEKLAKLDDISKMAEDTKMKVDVMYTVVKKHNVDINKRKLAK